MVVVMVMVGMTRMNFFEGKEWGKGGGGDKEGEFMCKNTLYIYWYIRLGGLGSPRLPLGRDLVQGLGPEWGRVL